jgi:hypothetical protein
MTNPVMDRRQRRRIGKVLVLVGIAPLLVSVLCLVADVCLGGFVLIPPMGPTGTVLRADELGLEGVPPDARVRVQFLSQSTTSSGEAGIPWYAVQVHSIVIDRFVQSEADPVPPLSDAQRDQVWTHGRAALDAYLKSKALERDEQRREVFLAMLRDGQISTTTEGYMWPNVPHAVSGLLRELRSLFLSPILCGVGAGLWSSSRKRIPPGFCLRCGYDLRATPQGGVCPECGKAQSSETPGKPAPSEP